MSATPFPLEISVDELARRRSGGETLAVLDVRDPWEAEICRLPDSIDVPLARLPEQVDSLPREGMLVILCHHGMRSQHAALWLRSYGFANAVNLAGGIDAWARLIDPSMRTY
jgi:rhodanese-related sulfurtransferase